MRNRHIQETGTSTLGALLPDLDGIYAKQEQRPHLVGPCDAMRGVTLSHAVENTWTGVVKSCSHPHTRVSPLLLERGSRVSKGGCPVQTCYY